MAAACSFDQWRKDAFFAAAEAVQESADVMESAYRMWLRDRSEGLYSGSSSELCRELQRALGTAKWQLEEFESAVKASHENRSSKDHVVVRHRQFITAIGSQISRVEGALRESFIEEGKQPLRWVQLDEEERDDLAIFLSAVDSGSDSSDNVTSSERSSNLETTRGFRETVTIGSGSKYIVELEANDPCEMNHKVRNHGDCVEQQKKTRSSPDIGSWKIVIADEVDRTKGKPQIKSSPSSNSINSQLKRRLSSYFDLKRILSFTQARNSARIVAPEVPNLPITCAPTNGVKRRIHASQSYLQFGRSLKITFLLVVSLFLIVPFVFYSS